MSERIGFMVLAKRPDERQESGFTFDSAGGIWPSIEPVNNHQVYCQIMAEADREKYGDVEYVIAELVAHESTEGES